MLKLAKRGFGSVNLALQGGGAYGLLYAGTIQALQENKINVKTTIGSSAGSLGSLMVGLNVPHTDIIDYANPKVDSPPGLKKPGAIQDIIPLEYRNKQIAINWPIFRQDTDVPWIFGKFFKRAVKSILNNLGGSYLDPVLEKEDDLLLKILLNGSFICGEELVRTCEDFLIKYIKDDISDQ